MKIGEPPGPVSFMSYLVLGIDHAGSRPARPQHNPAPVKTPSRPGSASAASLLMETIRAFG